MWNLASPTNATAATSINGAKPEVASKFQACPDVSMVIIAEETLLGSDLGDGVSEVVTEEIRAVMNQGLSGVGKNILPEDTIALRYFTDGRILAIDASGKELAEISGANLGELGESTEGSAEIVDGESDKLAGVLDEVKRIVGACLGFGGAGGMGFEQLVRWLGNPINAAKFVIRRIGIAGAISCIGGIIWTYI